MHQQQKKKTTHKRQGQCIAPGEYHYQRLFWLVVMVLVLFYSSVIPLKVQAQSDDALLVQPPDTTNFPIHTVQFNLPISAVQPESGLLLSQLRVEENGQEVSLLSLNSETVGVHFTLAINTGRDLDVRDANGISPYEKLSSVLTDWAVSRPIALNDTLSLVTNEGGGVRNTADPDVWVRALAGYQPNFRTLTPDLASLESGLRLAQERVLPFGVDRALLYITPPPTPEQIDIINRLAEEAQNGEVQVSVWMVGDPYFLTNAQGGALVDLASSTGGDFFNYTGVEPIPDLGTTLANLGQIFTLSYESNIRTSGSHSLRISAMLPDGEISGEGAPFYLEVDPPKPILLTPPAVITRQTIQEGESSLDVLIPDSFMINILIEFPDDFPRELTASRLYVDGRVVDVRTEPPFDALTWDLSSLNESGEHSIQVEIVDILGLEGRTILTPVQIEVVVPEPEQRMTDQQVGLTFVVVVLIAILVLLAVWLPSWIKRAQPFHKMRTALASKGKTKDQPNSSTAPAPNRVLARFLPLSASPAAADDGAVLVTKSPITIKRGLENGHLTLDDGSISEGLAQLESRQGTFWLKDLGSPNGTWVNYTQIGTHPVQINPGDLVHFGNLGFRFTINDNHGDKAPSQVTVTAYKPLL